MAVPLPSKVNCFIRAQKQPAEQGMRLEYPGKKPAEVILETPPGHYKPSAAYNSGKSRLYHGENLDVPAALMQDETVPVKVKRVYIDPPFAASAQRGSREAKHADDGDLIVPANVEA